MKTKSTLSNVILITLLTIANFSCNTPNETMTVDFREHWDTTLVLENPDKGWYHHIIDDGLDTYHIKNDSAFYNFPGMDHLYMRLAWSFLEPEEGVYNWTVIDTIIEKYVPMGYGMAFAVTSKERKGYPYYAAEVVDGIHYSTPHWVREAGAEGIDAPSKGTDIVVWTPDWDDPIFLEKLNNFHRAFAERYDDKPWVRYIDVSSIGDYGEGHTNPSTKIPPTVEEVKANIDLYKRNYKHSVLAASDALLFWNKSEEDTEELFNYAMESGITIRDDSPMVRYHLETYPETWSVSHPHFFDPLYKRLPTIFELQHYSSVKRDGHWQGPNGKDTIPSFGISGAEIFMKAMELEHSTYIGYHGYVEEFLRDNPETTGELLNRCGYWYFPVSASWPSSFKQSNNTVSIEWLNKGVAPAYKDYNLILLLQNENSGNTEIPVDAGNTKWMPDSTYNESYSFDLPEDIPPGKYNLKFKLMKLNEGESRDVLLGLSENVMDENKFISAGEVTIK